MKNIFSRVNLNLFTICLLIIVVIPLNLSRTDNFTFTVEFFISLILIALILSLILITFSILIEKIIFKLNIYPAYSFVIGFLLLWVFIVGNFFPVSGIPGPFSLDISVRLRYLILFKLVLTILFYLFLIKKDKKNYFLRFIYFYVLANIIFLSFNIQNEYKNHKDKNNLSEFGNKNLIVLSFDGISGHKIYDEVITDKEFFQSLKDFKFYKNTVSGAPYSLSSINIEINGKKINNNLNNILNKKNINTLVYGTYRSFVLDKNKESEDSLIEHNIEDYNEAFRINMFFQKYIINSLGRWGTPISTILIEPLIYLEIYTDFINLISFNKENKSNPFDYIKTPSFISLYEYDIIFENVTYNKNLNNLIRMYHFDFSHWPIKVNENCKEIKSFDASIKSYQQESIMLKCISKKIIKFINNLKKNKVYKNSMIVIKSDHGKPNCIERSGTKFSLSEFFVKSCNKHYKDYPYTGKINNNFYWGYGQYKPFIMIKNINQTQDEIKISDKQVFLHDLSATYCNFFSKPTECDYLNKNNLAADEEQFRINSYDIYLPKLEYPLITTQSYGFKKYTISNNITFLDFLKLNEIISSEQ